MDAIAVLKADHDQVDALFEKFEALGPRALKSKRRIADQAIEALSIHAAIEEMVLYPAVREAMPEETTSVLEALEEHHVVKWLMAELSTLDPSDERFDAKFTVMAENVRHHVKEEEGDLFKAMRKHMSRSELDTLATELDNARQVAPRRPHPRSPDTPPGNIVAAAITAPIDAAKDLGGRAAQRVRDVVSG